MIDLLLYVLILSLPWVFLILLTAAMQPPSAREMFMWRIGQFQIELGEALLPVVRDVAESLKTFLDDMAWDDDEN